MVKARSNSDEKYFESEKDKETEVRAWLKQLQKKYPNVEAITESHIWFIVEFVPASKYTVAECSTTIKL